MAFERRRDEEEEEPEWIPKTELGKKVKNKEIVTIDEVFAFGRPILEHQIVDTVLPDLRTETLAVQMTQRMTDNGRKVKFRAVVLVGDGNGHLGIGVGKADETRPAVKSATKHAKRNIIAVNIGCGSWECGCGTRHSVPIRTMGKNGSVMIDLKPAPRGVGIVANEIVRKVLSLAGVHDAWSFSRGATSSTYNTAMAVMNALDNLNKLRLIGELKGNVKPEAMPLAPAPSA